MLSFSAQAAALGSLFSGLAAIVTAVLSIRVGRKQARSECEERIKQLSRAFREGMKIGKGVNLS